MASTILPIRSGTWVQVNTVSTAGVIELIFGEVIFTQQAAWPMGTINDVARNGSMSLSGQERTYFTTNEPTERIYAYAVRDTALSITPQGGIL